MGYRGGRGLAPSGHCSSPSPVALAAQSARAARMLVIDGGGRRSWRRDESVRRRGARAARLRRTAQILAHYYTGTTIGQASPGRPVTRAAAVRAAQRRLQRRHPGRRAGRLGAAAVYLASAAAPAGTITLSRARAAAPLARLPAPLTIDRRRRRSARRGGRQRRRRWPLPRPRSRSSATAHGLEVINVVGLESYLRGVVPAESPASWPAAELEAQAIAARTYAVTSARSTGFDLYADTRSQQYGGVAAETPATDAAVAATAGAGRHLRGQAGHRLLLRQLGRRDRERPERVRRRARRSRACGRSPIPYDALAASAR